MSLFFYKKLFQKKLLSFEEMEAAFSFEKNLKVTLRHLLQ